MTRISVETFENTELEIRRAVVASTLGAVIVLFGAIWSYDLRFGSQSDQTLDLLHRSGEVLWRTDVLARSFELSLSHSLAGAARPQVEEAKEGAAIELAVNGVGPGGSVRVVRSSRTGATRRTKLSAHSRISSASSAAQVQELAHLHSEVGGITEIRAFGDQASLLRSFLKLRQQFALSTVFPSRPKQFAAPLGVQPSLAQVGPPTGGSGKGNDRRHLRTRRQKGQGGPSNWNGRAGVGVAGLMVAGRSQGDSRIKRKAPSEGDVLQTELKKDAASEPTNGMDIQAATASSALESALMGAKIDALRLSAATTLPGPVARAASPSSEQQQTAIHLVSDRKNTVSKIDEEGGANQIGPVATSAARPSTSLGVTADPVATHQSANTLPFGKTQFLGASDCVESFNWNSQVEGCKTSRVSKLTSSSVKPWVISSHPFGLPTLQRKISGPEILFTTQSLKQLELLTKIRQLNTQGLVFGRVGAGYSVAISGNGEQPLYLTTQHQPVSEGDLSELRYFVILNAAPGDQRVAVTRMALSTDPLGKSPQGYESVSVGVPVISGGATYIDMVDIREARIAGKVIQGNLAELFGIGGAMIQFLGTHGRNIDATVSSLDGDFVADSVRYVDGYPLDIQVSTKDGESHTHRFQIDPKESSPVLLPIFDAETVRNWKMQAGIKPAEDQSGAVIGAFPRLVRSLDSGERSHGQVSVQVKPLFSSHKTLWATRTIGKDGDLLNSNLLQANENRFCALGVESGPQVIELRDADDRLVWADVIFMSPDIVFPVGPN